jgi:sarcosine oxidase subunit gamma
MVISNEITKKGTKKYDVEEILYNDISKTNLGAVIDVTDHFVMLELEGKNIYELFATGSPFNFNEFKEKKGSTTQTLLNNIDVIIQNKGENLVNLFVRRSFSEHLYSWINDSASRL